MTHVTDEQLGKISRQWADVFRRVREGSLESEYVSSNLQRIIEQKLPAHDSATFTLLVNYGQSVEEALRAGNYDWANNDLTSRNFPPTRCGTDTVRLHLVHFNKAMGDDEITRRLEKLNLSDATIEELLALGANPVTRDLQRQFPIVARGSVWRDSDRYRNVPVLWRYGSERHAGLGSLGLKWDADYRFLVVGK